MYTVTSSIVNVDTEDEGTKILTKREMKNRNDVGLPSRV